MINKENKKEDKLFTDEEMQKLESLMAKLKPEDEGLGEGEYIADTSEYIDELE